MTELARLEDLRFASVDLPVSRLTEVLDGAIDASILGRPVLIIEDEAMIAWALESLLEDMGFTQIAIAANGAEAVEHAKQTFPGLILSDINLAASAMDGIAATATIAGPLTSVVFITAFASTDARQRIARDLPNAALLPKPVDEADLRRAIVDVSRCAREL